MAAPEAPVPPAPGEAALRAEVVRLKKMVEALMNRAERATSAQGSDFGLFQATIVLEGRVRERTRELEAALAENEKINRALQGANAALEAEKAEQRALIAKLEEAHGQLVQSEKLASIGQLAAGVAHEINNPIGFVNSNLGTLRDYVHKLLGLIDAYEGAAPLLAADPAAQERVGRLRREADLEFLREDVGQLIAESIDGTARVRRIVQDLRDFSRIDAKEWLLADLHAGLDSTLNVVANEIKYRAEVVREYGNLPPVECIASQVNQVFMNILVNAAQAMAERGRITIRTGCRGDAEVWVAIADTGNGIPPDVLPRIFDPFFTTKPVGKGTGLGLSVSYGIVQAHGGTIEVDTRTGEGTTFTIRLPVRRTGAGPTGEVRK